MSERVRPEEITRLILEMRNGDSEAVNTLIPLIYSQLRRMARSLLNKERIDHTLQPTALVNDVLMRLIGPSSIDWQSRAHFFATSATIMRHILIDHARSHRAEKRGGELQRVTLDDGLVFEWRKMESLLTLDDALNRLQRKDPRMAQVVEMKFFSGMTEEEIAEVLKLSTRTVKRDWQFARDWLYREISSPRSASAP